MKTLIILALSLSLTGTAHAGWFTEDYSEVNTLIAEANTDRLKEFGVAMAGCGDNAACQVAVGMAFAGNMGQQGYFKPESTSDFIRALLPAGGLVLDFTRLWRAGTSGDSSGFVVTGNGNTFSGIGNKLSATDRSTVTAPFSATVTTTTVSGNKWYSLNDGGKGSTVTDGGVVAGFDPTLEGK
ncbi:MAG TPA: hypothetical protein DCS09_09925 [Porphyromonadaceae bacterium]|nr:hypothetical protein [Porphyromonadaceae bacterium]